MTVLDLMRGDPTEVRAVAARMEVHGQRLVSVQRVLDTIRAGGAWDSPAGLEFERRVQECPPTLGQAARRLMLGASHVRAYAVTLEEELARAAAAAAQHDQAVAQVQAVESALGSAANRSGKRDEHLIDQLGSRRAEVIAQLRHHETVFYDAGERVRQANRGLARALDELSHDVLSDGLTYRVVQGARSVGDGVAIAAGAVSLFPPAAPFAVPVSIVAGGVVAAAVGIDAIVYGDSDLGDVLTSLALVLAAGGAKLGSNAAKVGATPGSSAEQASRIALAERLRSGARSSAAQTWHESRLRPSVVRTEQAQRRAEIAAAGGGLRARAVVARRWLPESKAAQQVIDDWRVVAGTGPGPRRTVAAAAAVRAGLHVHERVEQASSAATAVRAEAPSPGSTADPPETSEARREGDQERHLGGR